MILVSLFKIKTAYGVPLMVTVAEILDFN